MSGSLADVLRSFSFAYPAVLGALLLLPPALWWNRRRARAPALRLTTTGAFAGVHAGWRVRVRRWALPLRIAGAALAILAAARPQRSHVQEVVNSEGINIVLALDVSGSMLAEDLQPNRLEAARRVAADFIDARPGDRIGLVIFQAEAFTQCPVTSDHRVLLEQLLAARSGLLEDGTAIGTGLATAVDRLRATEGKSRVVILMTDGVNNAGVVDPVTATGIAQSYGVRVYTIGLGTRGAAPMRIPTPMGDATQMVPVEIDEPLMQRIAQSTGGRYFRATDNEALDRIYGEINRLEKYAVQSTTYRRYAELFYPVALAALACLFLEGLLRWWVVRSVVDV